MILHEVGPSSQFPEESMSCQRLKLLVEEVWQPGVAWESHCVLQLALAAQMQETGGQAGGGPRRQ